MSSMKEVGNHLILDIWGPDLLCDSAAIERLVRMIVEEAGATLLQLYFHSFGPEHGITGVALLAESHISIHTWPEHNFAAFDFFACGKADVRKAIAIVEKHLSPTHMTETLIARGGRPIDSENQRKFESSYQIGID